MENGGKKVISTLCFSFPSLKRDLSLRAMMQGFITKNWGKKGPLPKTLSIRILAQ